MEKQINSKEKTIPMGSVYKIIDIKKEKVVYVGQHWYNTSGSIKKFGKGYNDKYMGTGLFLKRVYKKYGKDDFKKIVITHGILEQEDMDSLEKFWIKKHDTIGNDGYNIHYGGYNVIGMKHSEESKKKMSKSQSGEKNGFFGKKHSKETIKKMSKKKSKEHRKKLSEFAKNRPQEHKDKLSKAKKGKPAHNKGKKMSEEQKKKLSEIAKNRPPVSEETRKKMSKAHKGRKVSEETRKKISKIHKGKIVSEETRKKLSKARKGEKASKETRKKLSEASKKAWKRRKSKLF